MDRAPTNVMSGSLGIFDDPDAFIGSQVFSDRVDGPEFSDLYPTVIRDESGTELYCPCEE